MNTENTTEKPTHSADEALPTAPCYADNLIGSIYSDHIKLHSQFSKDEWFIKITDRVELWEYPLWGDGKPTLKAEYDTAEEAYKVGVTLA